jgi:hypothetical protein
MKKSTKTLIKDAKILNAQKFMDKYGDDPEFVLLDADNLMNVNEGFLNIDYDGISILFCDGQLDSISDC